MWSIVFALPNLDLRESFGNNYVAIAPPRDPRVAAITAAHDTSRRFVGSFQDQFGQEVTPAVLIVNDDEPCSTKDIDGLVAFRNALALVTIIEAHELSLDASLLSHPRYTDYFDFYPISIARHEDGFLTSSPAVLGFSSETPKFTGQTSPALGGPKPVSLGLEKELLADIETRWIRRFIKRHTREWSTRCLFRSLEMAYQAASMPFANHSSLYDFGTALSLWVSAFEVLSRQRRRRADLKSVLDLLGGFDWHDRVIRRKIYRVRFQKKAISANLPQRLYADIYSARNAFLHGNPVALRHLYPFKRRGNLPITWFAPLLYKVALVCFLRGPDRPLGRRPSYRQIGRRSARELKLAEEILRARR